MVQPLSLSAAESVFRGYLMLKRKEKEVPAFTANGLPIDRSIKIEQSQAAKRAELNRNIVAY